MTIGIGIWAFLAYIGFILFWNLIICQGRVQFDPFGRLKVTQ